jgi:hypothetical protein
MTEQIVITICEDKMYIGQVINQSTNQTMYTTSKYETENETRIEIDNYLKTKKQTQIRRCCGR